MNNSELNSAATHFKKVMVIDDTQVDRFIAERNIKKSLFAEEVVVMESANAALNYLRSMADTPEGLPQLIFLDIRMPEKNGFDFLEDYSQLPSSVKKNSIIMMLSTSLNPEDHEKAKNNQYVSKFLNKPLDREKLQEIVNASANAVPE